MEIGERYLWFLFLHQNAMIDDNSVRETGKLQRSNRRRFLKLGGTTVASLVGASTIGQVKATPGDVEPDEEIGAGSKYESYDTVSRGSLYAEHLGSGLEVVDPGDCELRIAGDWVIENTETGETPNDSTNIGIGYQRVVIENLSPADLSIFTSQNSDEVGMNPQPQNHADADAGAMMSTLTGALSGAAAAAGTASGGIALSAYGLLSGMFALLNSPTENDDVYAWEGTHTYSQHQGGHHADFIIQEKTSNGGTVRVHSETANISNTWEIVVNNGVQNLYPVL